MQDDHILGTPIEDWQRVHEYNHPILTRLLQRQSILHLFGRVARQHSHMPFVLEIGRNQMRVVSYGEAHAIFAGTAAKLIRNYGLTEGARVGIVAQNDFHSIVAIVGTLLAGGVAVLLNASDPPKRLSSQLARTECELCIAPGDRILESRVRQVLPDDLAGAATSNSELIFEALLDRVHTASPAVIVFTTGSTSESKAVVQSHCNLLVNCSALRWAHRLTARSCLLCVLPLHHVNGLEFTIFASMIAGSRVVLTGHYDPFRFLDLIRWCEVTIASVVPSILQSLAVTRRPTPLPAGFRYFTSAAAALSGAMTRGIWARFGCQVVQGYGLSETTNFSTLMPARLEEAQYKRLTLDSRLPPVGGPLFGNRVTVLRPNGTEAAEGEVGEVCMRGASVMMGYLSSELVNRDVFRGGWFHSGDLGYIRTARELNIPLLYLTGRIKNIVKVSGESVSLDEVEHVIQEVPGVSEAACVGLPHEYLGEMVACAVVASSAELTSADIAERIRHAVPKNAVPRRFAFVTALPRFANGKINRSELRRVFATECDLHNFL